MDIIDQIREKNRNKKILSYFEKSTTFTIFLANIVFISLNSLEMIDNKLLNIFGGISSILVLVNDYTKYQISNINENINENIQKLEKTEEKVFENQNNLEIQDYRMIFSSNKKTKKTNKKNENEKNFWIPFCNF